MISHVKQGVTKADNYHMTKLTERLRDELDYDQLIRKRQKMHFSEDFSKVELKKPFQKKTTPQSPTIHPESSHKTRIVPFDEDKDDDAED